MDYIKNLENAVKNFETESKRLKNFNTVLASIDDLAKAILSEQNNINHIAGKIDDVSEPICSSGAILKEQCDNLKAVVQTAQKNNDSIYSQLTTLVKNLIENEQNNRKAFTTEVIDNITTALSSSTADIVKDTVKPLDDSKEELEVTCIAIEKLINECNAAAEENKKVVSLISDAVDAHVQEVKELYNGFNDDIRGTIGSELDNKTNDLLKAVKECLIAQREVELKITKAIAVNNDTTKSVAKETSATILHKINTINQLIQDTSSGINKTITNIDSKIDSLSTDTADMQKKIIIISSGLNEAKNLIKKISVKNSAISNDITRLEKDLVSRIEKSEEAVSSVGTVNKVILAINIVILCALFFKG